MAVTFGNFLSGVVDDNPLAIGAGTVNSSGFANLPVITAPATMWLVLDPLSVNGAPEIVTITAHTGSATSVTVTRAQQSTAARQHPLNTKWVAGTLTKQDVTSDFLRSTLITAKGSLYGGSGAGTMSELVVGANQQILRADSSQATGLKWDWLGGVPVFASTVARDAAISSPASGMACYVDSGDAAEGWYTYNGAAWRPTVWNAPWGMIGLAAVTAAQGSIGSSTVDATGLTVTWTAVANRNYRLSALVRLQQGGALGDQTVTITDNSNAVLAQSNFGVSGTTSFGTHTPWDVRSFSAGSQTVKVRLNTSSGSTMQANAATRALLLVEDVGPATGTPS